MKRTAQIKYLLALGLILVQASVLATDRYVAPSGSDTTGTGTASAPWQTIQGAYNKSADGDTIHLAAGNYTGGIWLRSARTLVGDSTPKPTVTFPAAQPALSINLWLIAPGSHLRNLEIVGGSVYAVAIEPGGGSSIENCIVRDSFADLIKCKPGSHDVLISGCILYKTPGLPISSNGQGIDAVTCDNLTVVDCFIGPLHDFAICVKGCSKYLTVKYNQIHDCVVGVACGGPDNGYNLNADHFCTYDAWIYRNLVWNIQDAAIYLMATWNTRVVNNTIINAASAAQGLVYCIEGVNPTPAFPAGVPNEGLFFQDNFCQLADGNPANGGLWQRPHWYIVTGGLKSPNLIEGNTYTKQTPNGAVYLWDFSVGSSPATGWINGSGSGDWALWQARYGEVGSIVSSKPAPVPVLAGAGPIGGVGP